MAMQQVYSFVMGHNICISVSVNSVFPCALPSAMFVCTLPRQILIFFSTRAECIVYNSAQWCTTTLSLSLAACSLLTYCVQLLFIAHIEFKLIHSLCTLQCMNKFCLHLGAHIDTSVVTHDSYELLF